MVFQSALGLLLDMERIGHQHSVHEQGQGHIPQAGSVCPGLQLSVAVA